MQAYIPSEPVYNPNSPTYKQESSESDTEIWFNSLNN